MPTWNKCCSLLLAFSAVVAVADPLDEWTPREHGIIDAMRIDHLGPPPPDPSNRFADDPAAAAFGAKLFHDSRFSSNGNVSCSTCHRANYHFTDDLALAVGVGLNQRRSMPLEGMAYQSWFFWDGRKDSLWSQALSPFEGKEEHGISRNRLVELIYEHYQDEYAVAIGPLPEWGLEQPDGINQVYVNCGKSIAAFIRTLKPGVSKFDHYAKALLETDKDGLAVLSPEQKKGLRIFVSKGKCTNCHNGPMFSNGEFHHVGVPDAGVVDRGRAAVIETIKDDAFNCMGKWSDADPETDCAHLDFLDPHPEPYERAFKTPSLRNVARRPPYMHAGQFASLSDLLKHYRAVSGKNGVDEIFHGDVSDEELQQLEAFLRSLNAEPVD